MKLPHFACSTLGLFWLASATPLLAADTVPAGPHIFDVRAFGATGDGKTLDTDAINRAIEAASAAGGGTVWFPAGTYASYSIHLTNNIALYLDAGSTILAAGPPPEDGPGGYDAPVTNRWDWYQDFGHTHWHNSLIWGENMENITIEGPGRIWGKGLTRGRNPRRTTTEPAPTPGPFGYPSRGDSLPAGIGDKAIALKNCRNVIIKDITILKAGHFGILPTGVDNFTIENVKIDTDRDGINIDCCRNVRIANCTINSPNDDGIVLKSTYALGELRPTENVTIQGCQVSGYDMGSVLDGTYKRGRRSPTGRIKFGTEGTGGFKNITIANCVFDYSSGLAIESVDGAALEDVNIANITMRDIVNSPIFIRLGNRARGPEGTPVSQLRRVNISNVMAYNVAPNHGILISGIPGHPIEDVHLSNIHIYYRGGGTAEQAKREVPEYEKDYPEPGRFGRIPSWGMFVRHVKNIEFDHVTLNVLADDLRPACLLDDVDGASFSFVNVQKVQDVPTFVLKNVSNFNAVQCRPVADKHLDHVEQQSF